MMINYFQITSKIRTIIKELSLLLLKEKIPSPQLEARILLRIATNYSLEELIRNEEKFLSEATLIKLNKIADMRLQHIPIAYIENKKEFYGEDFYVDESVLIPRSDSEILIDAVLDHIKDKKKLKILDLGTGSACLLITLVKQLIKRNHLVYGIGVDTNDLKVAKRNVTEHNLNKLIELKKSDWFSNINEKFDIIIANPPYISEGEIPYMAFETLNHEPKQALFAIEEGLFCYKQIAKDVMKYLNKGGLLALEIGFKQKSSVGLIFKEKGLDLIGEYKDLGNNDRVLVFEN